MRYAGVGLRAAATVVDTAILLAVFYLIAAAAGQTTEGGFELEGAPFFAAVVIFFAYYIVFEALYRATPGKMLLRLQVARDDGRSISWADSTVRNLFRLIDGLILYIVGAAFVWLSARKQRLGDRVAGTVVVRKAERQVSVERTAG